MDTVMLRGIWASFVLGLLTVVLSLPVMIIVPLVPRWNGMSMVLARLWSRIMLRVVGARVVYHDPLGALQRSECRFARPESASALAGSTWLWRTGNETTPQSCHHRDRHGDPHR